MLLLGYFISLRLLFVATDDVTFLFIFDFEMHAMLVICQQFSDMAGDARVVLTRYRNIVPSTVYRALPRQ